MKVCTMCKQIFPATLEYFYAHNARGKDGLHSECKSCISKRGKLYREANRVKCAERARSYYDGHKEDLLEYRKAWATNNIVRVRELKRKRENKRRAAIAGGGGSYTVEEWKQLLKDYDYCCVKCYTETQITVDHIIPISKGGANTIDNIQPLCLSCNVSKGAKTKNYKFWYMAV